VTTYEILSLVSEAVIIFILLVEFWYDAWWNNRARRTKRRNKKDMVFITENITLGEGK